MRLLLLSFYYPPDLSAGSFRARALAEALAAQIEPGGSIDVITTAPNRYSSFTEAAVAVETSGPLTIRRIPLPAHRSDTLGQSRAFAHFAWTAGRCTARVPYDVVIATSSRLMTAALGAHIAGRGGARLYLDIRDIFVDTIGDVFPRLSWVLRAPLSALERWTVRRADRINLVSRGFESYFDSRYSDRSYSWFTNGIDEEFVAARWSHRAARDPREPLHVVYAGNIGEGQGLHAILPALAQRAGGRLRFSVIGDGGRRELLLRSLREAGVGSVELLPPLSRPALIEAYAGADILFLHLNAHAAFEKVLPSKIFEYAATGKPIWAGVAGHAARFIREEVANAAVFVPCDAADALLQLESLRLCHEPRAAFSARYARGSIAAAMARDVLRLARNPAP